MKRRPRHTRRKRKAPPRLSWGTLHHSKAGPAARGTLKHYTSGAALFHKTAERLDRTNAKAAEDQQA